MSESFVVQSRLSKSLAGIRLPILLHWVRVIEMWLARRQGWQDLNALDVRMLNDVGITPEQAFRGAGRPFWKL
jgi:uncharacterized protein YjiS (DUF1127 family)